MPYTSGWGLNLASVGATPAVHNTGLFQKTSSGSSQVDWRFENDGEVQVQVGDVYFFGGGIPDSVGSGSWTGAGNGRLVSGTFSWGAGVQVSGKVTIAGATVTAGDVQGSGSLTISSGSLALSSSSTIGSLTMSGGTLTGAGDLSVASGFAWTAGTMSGTGRTTIGAGVSAGSVSGGTLDRVLVNSGSLTASSGRLLGTSAARLENEGTFTHNMPHTSSFGLNRSVTGATPSFRNTGVFRKTVGTGLGIVDWQFENVGSVQAQTGDLYFQGGSIPGTSASGSWTGAGLITLASGAYTWGAGVQVDTLRLPYSSATLTAGDVQADSLTSSGTVTLTGTSAVSHFDSLTISAGSLTGAGDVDVASAFSWAGGTMSGTGSTTINSSVTAGSITGGTLDRTLVNNGALTATTGRLYGTSSARLENAGTFTHNFHQTSGSGLNLATAGATPVLINTGVFRKTSDPVSLSIVDWQFDNQGEVRSESGDIYLQGGSVPGSTSSGSWTGAGRATFAIGTYTLGGGVQVDTTFNLPYTTATVSAVDIQGNGALSITNGTLSLEDPTTVSHVDTLTMIGGSGANLTGAGDLMVASEFSWGGQGTMSGAGRTILSADVSAGSLSGGKLGRTLVNRGTLTIPANSSVSGLPNGVLENRGLLVDNADGYNPYSMKAAAGSPIAALRNLGVVTKTAGVGDAVIDWGVDNRNVIAAQAGHGRIVLRGPDLTLTDGSAAPGDDSEDYGDANFAIPGRTHCDEADPVNCSTGNFYEEETDLVVAGRGPALRAGRAYNAMAAVLETGIPYSRLSPGWTHPYAARLERVGDHVVLHGANAATATFSEQPDGSFTAAERVKAELVQAADDSYTVTYRDQTKDIFDSTGRLTAQRDRNGYETSLIYTAGGRLDQVTDDAGRSLDYTYDADGRIETITDPLGRDVTYGYDTAGDLVSVTDVGGGVTEYGYDGEHRIVSMRNPRDYETTNEYDDENRVTAQTDAKAGVTAFAYTTTSTTVTDPRGHETRYEQTSGLTTEVVKGVGTAVESTTTMVRDASGNVTQRTDPNGQLTQVDYDAAGNPTEIIDPLNRVTTLTYTAGNDVETVTDPVATTTFDYDSGGNLISASRPLVGSASTATTTYDYDPGQPGDLLSTTDPNGKVWSNTYDADGNRTSATDPEGNKTTSEFNAIGWPTSTVSPRGNATGATPADYQTTIAYDDFGAPTRVEDPLAHASETTYDANGNPITVKDPSGTVTTTTYDELDRPTSVKRPDDSTVTLAYDAVGNRTSVKDALNHATTFSYDALDRVSAQVDALNRATTYGYDASGRMTSILDAAGRTATLSYDAASQLTGIAYSDGVTAAVSYGYDQLGRRTSMTDGTGTSTRAYDSLGRLTSATDGAGRVLGYTHDLGGRLTKITYPAALVAQTAPGVTITDPSVIRGYDDAGRLTSVKDWLGSTTAFSYDRNGNLTGQTYPNATSAALTYNRADELTQRTDTGPTGTILNLPYTRNADGQVATQNQTATQPGATGTLSYDPRHQLSQVSVAGNATATYVHDVADRLTRIGDATSATTLEYDVANQLTRTVNPSNGATRSSFTYDQLGNRKVEQPASTGGLLPAPAPTNYTYNQANQLTRVQRAGSALGTAAIDRSYGYDGDGLRADLLWDKDASLPLVLGDQTALYITGPDGLPVEQLGLTGTRRFYHHDQLGSTRALTDTNGAVAARRDYDPYGRPTTPIADDAPFGFAGQYTDQTTGLIYMRARWYDPNTGLFITADPIGLGSGETNLYHYANGDPANRVDPSGLFGLDDIESAVRDAARTSFDIATAPVDLAADAIGEVGEQTGITDVAQEALEYWAAVSIDPCASGGMRLLANVAGPLSALATRDNIGSTALVFVNGVGYARGTEIVLGSKTRRIAPWGNRTGHPTGRYPHYHWQRTSPNGTVKPGGSYKRHRPWDKRQTDTSWKDRL